MPYNLGSLLTNSVLCQNQSRFPFEECIAPEKKEKTNKVILNKVRGMMGGGEMGIYSGILSFMLLRSNKIIL